MDWEHFLHSMKSMFYIELVMAFISILVITTYILKKKRVKSTAFLAIISTASLIQGAIIYYDELMFQKTIFSGNISQNSLYPYLIVELSCCLLFIKSNIQSLKTQKLAIFTILAFTVYTLIFWLRQPSSKKFILHIPAIEGFAIIFFCLYYFYEAFTLKPDRNLPTEPSFWAISGMLFTFSTITPLFILVDYLHMNSIKLYHIFYIINYISYCLLFITFIIAIWNDKRNLI